MEIGTRNQYTHRPLACILDVLGVGREHISDNLNLITSRGLDFQPGGEPYHAWMVNNTAATSDSV